MCAGAPLCFDESSLTCGGEWNARAVVGNSTSSSFRSGEVRTRLLKVVLGTAIKKKLTSSDHQQEDTKMPEEDDGAAANLGTVCSIDVHMHRATVRGRWMNV